MAVLGALKLLDRAIRVELCELTIAQYHTRTVQCSWCPTMLLLWQGFSQDVAQQVH